jgi:signal transduction histidine kinase
VRSLYIRILAVSFVTLVVSLIAFLAVFFSTTQPHLAALLGHIRAMQTDETVDLFERSGRDETARYLERLDKAWGLSHTLTDARGYDLVSGVNRSAMLAAARSNPGRPTPFGDDLVMAERSVDGRFYLLAWGRPPFTLRDMLPYYALILAAVGLMCWLLAVGIVAPLRRTASVIDRLGKGDLAARTLTQRRDEIGELGRSVDQMAERLQTLLTAERRLLQDISHELRSPLTRLSLAIELVPETDDRESAAARLRREADRLTSLVTSLVEVTRAEGDPDVRKFESIDVTAMLRDIVDSCGIESAARDVTIDTATMNQAIVHGDPELLHRAFENVLRNAIRYTATASAIDITCQERAEAVVVSVRDRGPGVSDRDLSRLGEPFFRVDDSRDAASGGVGLGLSIARRAVHLHHGTLIAENAGPGLRITISLPRAPHRAVDHVRAT